MRVILFAGITAAFCSPSIAQDVSRCLTISDNLERWSCYDDAAGYKPASDEPEDSEQPSDTPARVVIDYDAGRNWTARTRVSEFEDTTDVFLSTPSKAPLMCSDFGGQREATLMIRCLENTTAVIINTHCHVASGFQGYGEVDVRIDDEAAFNRSFDASTDNSALGLWNGGSAIPFVKRLLDKETLRLRFTPFNKSPVTAEFDISGLDAKIGELRDNCGW